MKYKKIFVSSILLLILFSCGGESSFDHTEAVYSGSHYVIDKKLALIVYNGDEVQLDSNHAIDLKGIVFNTDDQNLIVGKGYEVTYQGKIFVFYKSELPIVFLNTGDETIPNKPKINGELIILETGEDNFESLVGIEVRGGTSKKFPKQSFSMELWESKDGKAYKERLLNLRKDDDWVLDGMWNEPLRLRDFVGHSLWLKMGRYPYAEKKPNVTLGIDKKYVELFLNGSYRGVYYLGEKIDRKQLALKKYKDGINGELYKGKKWKPGIVFSDLEDYSNRSEKWSGYEAKYPDEIGHLNWSNLYQLVDFVVNSNQDTFNELIASKVDLENMADYYIFLNMIYGSDNNGKNLYTGRYNQQSTYFFVPWDMDASFGDNWEGKRVFKADQMISNGLYKKLLQNDEFKSEVKNRWNKLKDNVLSIDNLQSMFSLNYKYLKDNGVYEREGLNPELLFPSEHNEIDFIHTWIKERYFYLDNYFNEL